MLIDVIGNININSASENLSKDYDTYILRNDIDNGVSNNIIEDYYVFPKYLSQSVYVTEPMSEDYPRKGGPTIHKYGNYLFMVYMPQTSHSSNVLNPSWLEFSRSKDLFKTYELCRVKCINDNGTMREIDPIKEGYFPRRYQLTYVDNKLWIFFGTADITTNPPVSGGDYTIGKTYCCYSEDFGDTWSELIVVDDDGLNSMYINDKPIVVGDEIWLAGYNTFNAVQNPELNFEDLHSWVLKFNYITKTKVSKTQIDTTWTDTNGQTTGSLSTSEPTIIEYNTGKFLCVSRVNWNNAYPGEEKLTIHMGEIIAYSDDGVDWSNYEFHMGGYPNQPRLFKYKNHVYYSRGLAVIHGEIDGDNINWVRRTTGNKYWFEDRAYYFRCFLWPDVTLKRYDPREEYKTILRDLYHAFGVSLECWDEDKDILVAAAGFKNDTEGIGENWIAIIKRNMIGSGYNYTERSIHITSIPGDLNTSNSIKIFHSNVSESDDIKVFFYDVENKPKCEISATLGTNNIIFNSSSKVANAKIVYEIIKN